MIFSCLCSMFERVGGCYYWQIYGGEKLPRHLLHRFVTILSYSVILISALSVFANALQFVNSSILHSSNIQSVDDKGGKLILESDSNQGRKLKTKALRISATKTKNG
jgi:hypothetical protein